MFFYYSDTNFVNRCDPTVVAEMNRLRREAGISGIYGDYNNVVSSLAVYLAMVSRPWDRARMPLTEAMELTDKYPEFVFLCAAVTQADMSVATLLGMDDYTSLARVPIGSWKLKIPQVLIEQLLHVCEQKGCAVPDNIRLNNWETVFTREVKGERVLIVTPIEHKFIDDIHYVQNGATGERKK